MNAFSWEETVEEGGLRLDRWLSSRLPACSMSRVRGLIREGRVEVNGRKAKKGDQLRIGDRVAVRGPVEAAGPVAEAGIELEVLYEDDDVLVVDKPAGVPTQPLAPEERGTLINAALARWPELRGIGSRELEPGLIHRLDSKTSGLVMMVKNQRAFEFMRHEFEMHRVKKVYRAIVRGEVRGRQGAVEVPLAHHPGKRGLMVVAGPGARHRGRARAALTRYRVLEKGQGLSLLELELVTGVMHQLRVHLAHIGHPVLGDDRYGDRPDPDSRAYALQACRLGFMHPGSGSQVDVTVRRMLALEDKIHWPSRGRGR